MKTNKLITLLLILTIFTLMTEMEDRVRTYSTAVIDRVVANVSVKEDTQEIDQAATPQFTLFTKSAAGD